MQVLELFSNPLPVGNRFETAFESEDSFLRLVVDLCVAAGDILQQPQTAVEVLTRSIVLCYALALCRDLFVFTHTCICACAQGERDGGQQLTRFRASPRNTCNYCGEQCYSDARISQFRARNENFTDLYSI